MELHKTKGKSVWSPTNQPYRLSMLRQWRAQVALLLVRRGIRDSVPSVVRLIEERAHDEGNQHGSGADNSENDSNKGGHVFVPSHTQWWWNSGSLLTLVCSQTLPKPHPILSKEILHWFAWVGINKLAGSATSSGPQETKQLESLVWAVPKPATAQTGTYHTRDMNTWIGWCEKQGAAPNRNAAQAEDKRNLPAHVNGIENLRERGQDTECSSGIHHIRAVLQPVCIDAAKIRQIHR
jgi:hypothetical protein